MLEDLEFMKVPVSVLREFYTDRVTRTSVRGVATETGVGRTTIHKFVYGKTRLSLRIRRLLAEHYLAQEQRQADILQTGFAAAVDALTPGLPGEAVDHLPGAVAAAVEHVLSCAGHQVPAWVTAKQSGGEAAPTTRA